ncbi:MAG: DUF222 domain-containing protein [Acidimicrobiales bacterium]
MALTRETDRLFTLDGGRGEARTVRTGEQRRADALASLLNGASAATEPGKTPRRTPVRHQVVVVAHADGTAEIPGAGPIPAAELAKLYCTSELFGIVFGTDGQPLWHGTGVRLADDNQWRALIARDGGCVVCDAHPSRCHAHHVVHARPPINGPTDIDNLALVCSHHHHLIHDHDHELRQHPDRTWTLTTPDTRTRGP